MNPAPHLIRGQAYDESYRALLEAHEHLRQQVQYLFEPGPRLVGYPVSDVGSFGDEAWHEVKGLLSTISKLEYRIRLRAVLAVRYSLERKERLRARRKRERPVLRDLMIDQRLWQRRITED